MPLQAGDIRFARSAVMADVDNGGGPPTSQLVPDGASNAIFPDISEDARTGGLVEVRHLHGVLRNTDTDALLGANMIVAEPPNDPNVSITLVKSPGTFARRPDIVKLIEATSTPGSETNGFMLENHVQGQRSLLLAQRPGLEPPAVNTSLVLIKDEGLPTEVQQFVRVRRVTLSLETFTESTNSGYVDFQIQVAACELFSPLNADFPGSAANRLYSRQANKTKTRRVNVTDAGTFYSAGRLVEATAIDDVEIKMDTIYTQIVPNTRTETPLLNQFPGGLRTVTLTDSQGTLEVTSAAHTDRIFIEEANQGFSHVFKLSPPPAPNSVTVSAVSLGNWTTVVDNGAGTLGGGPGSGTVLYSTGDLAITLENLPDYNTFIIVTWADTAGFVNMAPAGPFVVATNAPEFALPIAPGASVDGLEISWVSGGVAKLATANAAGVLSGDAAGLAVSASGVVYLRPAALPDAGGTFTVDHASRPTVTESFAGVSVDAGGYASLALTDEPIPGTVNVRWVTARKVSASSGSNLAGTSSSRNWQDVTPTPNLFASPGSRGGLPVWRVTTSNSSYIRSTESANTNTEVLVHTITDDGVGGFGVPALGAANYVGKSLNLRLVSAGSTTQGYRSDHESASSFNESSMTISTG